MVNRRLSNIFEYNSDEPLLEVISICIELNVHKRNGHVAEMKKNGNVKDQYDIRMMMINEMNSKYVIFKRILKSQ